MVAVRYIKKKKGNEVDGDEVAQLLRAQITSIRSSQITELKIYCTCQLKLPEVGNSDKIMNCEKVCQLKLYKENENNLACELLLFSVKNSLHKYMHHENIK